MTPEQREELKQAAMKATPGPWHVQYGDDDRHMCMTAIATTDDRMGNCGQFDGDDLIAVTFHQCYPTVNYERDDLGEFNSHYIAAANPSAILSLIAQVEALTVPDDYFAPVVLNPTCACAKCNPNAAGRMMILCATCGNKRCPHATDHRFACTDSNEPGQPGSSYGPTIPAIPGKKEGA